MNGKSEIDIDIDIDIDNIVITNKLYNFELKINNTVYKSEDKKLSINFTENNIIYSNVSVNINGIDVDINYKFDKYRLDLDLLNDENYMNATLFSAPSRKYRGNELYFILSNLINVIEDNNPFLGGILTLLAYRIGEEYNQRIKYLDVLYAKKSSYDNKIALTTDVAVRWYFSSSATISILLLLDNRHSQAESILDNQWGKSSYASISSHSGWNRAICNLNFAIISFINEDFEKSLSCASEVYNSSKIEILNLNSHQNPFILFQSLDCKMLIDLIQNAIILIKLIENKVEIPSKYKNIRISPKHKININTILKRFSITTDLDLGLYEKIINT
jgi:hypothetical protein